MSKVIQAIATVGFIALGIFTGGLAFLPGTALAFTVSANTFLALGLAVGASLVQQLTIGKGQGRSAAAAQLQLGEQPRQAILGRAAVSGTLVDAFNYGGKYGTDWEVLVIALADHRCDALEGFYVDDTWVPYTGDGDVPGFNGQLRAFWRNGAWGQEVPWILTDHGPGWTADDRGWNVAYAVVAYKADDEKAKNPVWTGGRPRFRFVVRGLRCYDPRKDSTVGGSGSHRRNNAETWEFSENPIVIRHNWVRGIYAGDQVNDPAMLLIGRGLSELEAPPQNVFARANLCDELVDGQPRYRIGGLVAATEPFINVETDFAAAVGGVISQPEGAVEVDPGQAKAPVAHFTDADIIVGSRVSWSEFLGQQDDAWINTVVARFTDPDQRWNVRSAPVRRETADVIADRGPREVQPLLDFVTNLPQSQRVAEIIRRLGRLWGRASVTLPPRFAFLEEGDWVTWQSDRRFGGATRTFRVEAWGSNKAWHHQLTLRQISASVFSDTDPLDDGVIASTRTPPPVVAAPGAGAWAASLITYESGGLRQPAVRIDGAVDDPAAQLVVFEYVQQLDAPNANTVWGFAGTARPDVTRLDIPVTTGGRYWVGVSYSVDGILGDRRVLGPVDAGELTYADGTPVQTLQPAEPGATEGARVPRPGSGVPGNIKDDLGRIYDPGELLNTSISLTPGGRLEYRPLPNIPPITLGSVTLPDLGAASIAALRRAEDDVDQLSRALATALDEASRTRAVFTDAGFYADPATGQIRIHAIEQTRERVSLAEIRLNAAEASINLRATSTYVDQQIALAAINPSQTADLTAVFSRLTAAEVDIDGLQATVTTLATATELSLVSGRVTTAQSEIDALEGVVSTKVDTTTFNALATRVTSAESTLTAFGDAASILNSVTAIRLLERDQDAGAENDLRVLLQGDRQQRDQVAAIASARQEITARLIEGDAAEAAARLALQVRVGVAEASVATEATARITGDNALASSITALSVSTTASLAAINASITTETAARTSADSALSTAISNLSASLSDLDSELTASITAADQARVSGDNALAASITNLTANLNTAVANLNASVDTEAQARIDGDNLIAAGLAQQVTAGRVADGEAAALAEELLGALLTGDRTRRESGGALAAARQEITARIVSGEEAFATALTALVARVAGTEASIVTEQQVRASAIQSLAQSITSLNASFTTQIAAETSARNTAIAQATNNLGSDIITERDARIAAIQAEAAARGTALTAEEQERIAAINAEAAARQAAIAAEQAAREQAVTTLTASIQAESTARANADGALASQITTLTATATGRNRTFRQGTAPSGPVPGDLWLNSAAGNAMLRWDGSTWVPVDDTRIADNAAAITLANQVRANADTALAASITSLTTTVNGNTASINQFAESINGLRTRWGIRTDNNGRVTGIVLNSSATESDFTVVTDTFRVFAAGMTVARAPFEFDAASGNLRLAGNIRVGGDAIIDGSLSAGALVADGVTRTFFATNSTTFSLVPDIVDNVVTITVEMERPGSIVLWGSYAFTYTAAGSWSANIAVNGAVLQSGTSNTDRYASFSGAFFAPAAGTYTCRMRASGNAAINAGGACLTVLRTYA